VREGVVGAASNFDLGLELFVIGNPVSDSVPSGWQWELNDGRDGPSELTIDEDLGPRI
jgi:hypothetical protein